MPRVLMCWLGETDFKMASRDIAGPIAAALEALPFDELVVLNDYTPLKSDPYLAWLKQRTSTRIVEERCDVATPMDFGGVYTEAMRVVDKTQERHAQQAELTFHLSPGTSAMATIWVILSKAKYAAALIQSSTRAGVEYTDIPFEIAADFIPDLYRRGDAQIEHLTAGLPPAAPAFAAIVHSSKVMAHTVALARRFAARKVRVLIEGESGTGKELMARAIHDGSLRRGKEMKVVNCGAIPRELVESILFGHKKGTFSGAAADRVGLFESADGSTLFLDEIGELPMDAQVKLLRVLQENRVQRIGDTVERPIDVRVVAATNRNLAQEVRAGRFREDLFYRLAEVVIQLPPLRERGEDLGTLVDSLMEQINQRFGQDEHGYEPKRLAAGARSVLRKHSWPGNIRELQSVLTRAAITTVGDMIGKDEIEQALFQLGPSRADGVLDRPLAIDIQRVLNEVKRHYLERALEQSHGNLTRAAELVGLKSYKVFGAWLEKARSDS